MMRALFTAATGVEAQQFRIDIIANNLANVNTVGFKRSRGDFQDLLYQTLRPAGAASSAGTQVPTGIQIGQGTKIVASQKMFKQGDFQQTQNDLDIAVEGSGFFQIRQPNGELAYTRAGTFKRDSEGKIVSSDGFILLPEITMPAEATNISIGADGTVSVIQAGQVATTRLGQIELAQFINPAGLNSTGKNLFVPTDSSGQPIVGTPGERGLGTLAQGFIENSNVSIAEELVNMIIAQRAYELNSKVIKVADDLLKFSTSI